MHINSKIVEPKNTAITVVMAGPMPPRIGGMTTCIENLLGSSLRGNVCFKVFDTSKQTTEGRTLFVAVVARYRLLKNWWGLIGKSKNTVVHIHTCSGLSFFLDGLYLLAARMRKLPVILHVHGGRFDVFLDQLNPLMRSLAGFLARRATKVVVLSLDWQEKISNRIKGIETAVIYNGVPVLCDFVNKKEGDVLNLLFLGTLNTNKGILELVDAMQNTPDNVKLFVVGEEGEPGFRAKVEDRISSLKLQNKILLTGALRGKEKQDCINNCHVFLMPSHYEGLPISLLEAMAAGLTAVVTPVGAIPLVVRNNIEALYVEAGNIGDIHKAIIAVYEDANLRESLSKAAYTRCVENFSINVVADAWLSLYFELVQKKTNW